MAVAVAEAVAEAEGRHACRAWNGPPGGTRGEGGTSCPLPSSLSHGDPAAEDGAGGRAARRGYGVALLVRAPVRTGRPRPRYLAGTRMGCRE